MSAIQLGIDENKKIFIITGDLSLITRNRRARYYFLDVLNSVFDTDSATIHYEEKDKENILKKIQNAFESFGIEQLDSPNILAALDTFYTEKENFKRFSQSDLPPSVATPWVRIPRSFQHTLSG